MHYASLLLSFPAWKPHFTFLSDPSSNELIVLRLLHFIFGVIWIGLLYFFNLVLAPTMQKLDPSVRVKVHPVLMSRAMLWFRWSALITVLMGLRYFFTLLASDARNAGDSSLTLQWFGWWLLVWLVAYALIYALQLPAKGFLDSPWVRTIGVAVVVIAASWLVLALNGGPSSSNQHLAISVGGGLGVVMLLNTWGVVWRHSAAARGGPLDAVGVSDGADLVLAIVPDAVFYGRFHPLPVLEHGGGLKVRGGPGRPASLFPLSGKVRLA